MFRDAVKIAAEFTRPVVVSRRAVNGKCASAIAAFVVLNQDGWIVTAGHVLRQWHKLVQSVDETKAAQKAQSDIKASSGLTNKERKKRLAAIRVGKDDSDRCSAWWGVGPHTARLKDFTYNNLTDPKFGEVIDFGVGRLEPFKSDWIKTYPVFKDPTKDFDPGVSLCKLGFPFHEITPKWDEAKGAFILPPEARPLPRFPIDGILTRIVNVVVNGLQLKYPIQYIETSTPGLKGQSGGPMVDSKGTVWAIQAKTSSWPLGFSGPPQFLNVGMGIHPSTLFGFFEERGIKYQKSTY